jgi:hypothetical protein
MAEESGYMPGPVNVVTRQHQEYVITERNQCRSECAPEATSSPSGQFGYYSRNPRKCLFIAGLSNTWAKTRLEIKGIRESGGGVCLAGPIHVLSKIALGKERQMRFTQLFVLLVRNSSSLSTRKHSRPSPWSGNGFS